MEMMFSLYSTLNAIDILSNCENGEQRGLRKAEVVLQRIHIKIKTQSAHTNSEAEVGNVYKASLCLIFIEFRKYSNETHLPSKWRDMHFQVSNVVL